MNVIEEIFFFHKKKNKWKKESNFVEVEHTNIHFIRHPDFHNYLVYFDSFPCTPVAVVEDLMNMGKVLVSEIVPSLTEEGKTKIRKAYREMRRETDKEY